MSRVRPAEPDDIPAILTLWNTLIRETDITFTATPKTDRDIADFLASHAAAQDPVFVLDEGGGVQGFAAYHPFRAGDGYGTTREISINLAPAVQGQGHGAALLTRLENTARNAALHALMAGITATNAVSLSFFAGHGYVEVGRIPEIARKFDRWHDLVLMQKIL